MSTRPATLALVLPRRREMFVRRRRPLLNAAMIGGVGYMAGRAGQRNAAREQSEQERIADLEQADAQAQVPAAAATGIATQIQQLVQLRDSGALTPAEFDTAKSRLLAPASSGGQ
jgi:membrane protease subunit (stomatin/prohibitin family)